MRVLFDVNVLIALIDPGQVHHDRAHAWWAEHREAGWASCPITQIGLVRVLSQPRYPNAVSTPEAVRCLQKAVSQNEHAFWPDDVSPSDAQRIDSERVLGPRQVTDVYLLSLAVQNGGRLATFDRAIPVSAVRGAKPDHIVVV